ncbi:MAG TPA: hypothetical protein PLV85_23980, partial [Polyangiaceae bacterium]|nr:hypothetical protein [Polyangiaceae bacterium]
MLVRTTLGAFEQEVRAIVPAGCSRSHWDCPASHQSTVRDGTTPARPRAANDDPNSWGDQNCHEILTGYLYTRSR